jgi:hypothetical protein
LTGSFVEPVFFGYLPRHARTAISLATARAMSWGFASELRDSRTPDPLRLKFLWLGNGFYWPEKVTLLFGRVIVLGTSFPGPNGLSRPEAQPV